MRRAGWVLAGVMVLVWVERLGAEELELVQLVVRNGELSAEGGLTDVGRERARRLGLALRRRYLGRLGPGAYAYAARARGCAESARHLLDAYLERDEPRPPIKRASPPNLDLLMDSTACSEFTAVSDSLRAGPEVSAMLARYDGLYRYLREIAGIGLNHGQEEKQLLALYGELESRRGRNESLPAWCPDGVYGLLGEFAALQYDLDSHSRALRRLNGGPLLRRLLDGAATPGLAGARLRVYAGEGRNVAALARALGTSFPRLPSFGCAVLLESWSGARLRLLVWTGVSEKLFPIRLRGCDEMCPAHRFASIVKQSLPTDREMRCLADDATLRQFKL